jgi:hypothetical protein
MANSEIFEPYEKLVDLSICGRTVAVPENNSLLRCMQYLRMSEVSNGDFCWNGECLNCEVRLATDSADQRGMACRLTVAPKMRIVRVSDELARCLGFAD